MGTRTRCGFANWTRFAHPYTHVRARKHIRVHTHRYAHACMETLCDFAALRTRIGCAQVRREMHAQTLEWIRARARAHAHAGTDVCTHTQTHRHTCTRTCAHPIMAHFCFVLSTGPGHDSEVNFPRFWRPLNKVTVISMVLFVICVSRSHFSFSVASPIVASPISRGNCWHPRSNH